jgi:flagellar biosynthesis protein FliR
MLAPLNDFDPQNAVLLLLTFARVGSLLLTAPILGSRQVPVQYRFLLAGFAAVAIFPLTSSRPSPISLPEGTSAVDWASAQWLPLLFSEVSIGIMLGLGMTIVISAARTAGTIIGQLAGMQWTTDADTESDEPITAISQLFGMLSIAVFVVIGGPEMVLSALIESYESLPISTTIGPGHGLAMLGNLLQQSLILTLRGVAPAVASLLISTITIGMLSRAFPFMNMLGLGFNSNQFMFFLATFLTMGGCVWLFMDDVGGILNSIQQSLLVQP